MSSIDKLISEWEKILADLTDTLCERLLQELRDLDSEGEEHHAFTCPECGSHYWGTSALGGRSEWTVHCHGANQARPGRCTFSGPYDDHILSMRMKEAKSRE
jgi:hypothetical protein